MKSIAFLLITLLAFSACNDYNPRDRQEPEWKKYYDENGISEAGFELLDNSHEMVHYYNIDRVSKRMCPASTFKILNALIALETGVASDEKMIIKYNGEPSWNEAWNKDLTLEEAFKVSAVPYFQELARRIGRERMQHFIDSCEYGNKKIGPAIDQFWLDGSLLISPDEQVGFVKQLYFDKLPFSKRTHRIVQNLMIQEDSLSRAEGKPFRLSYKTGTLPTDSGTYTAWMVGYVEDSARNAHPYIFCNNMEIPKSIGLDSMVKLRLRLTKEILRDQNVL